MTFPTVDSEALQSWLLHEAGVVGGLVLIVIITAVALWLSRVVVGSVVGTVFKRQAAEGRTAELGAIETQKRRRTIQDLCTAILRIVIVAVAAFNALLWVFPDINLAPILATFGVVGVALGIGAQNLVRDYIAGAFILVENQYAKGDVVQLAGVSGKVEDLSLRRTVLRDMDGTVHSVPNGLILVASNMTRAWNRINIDLTVAYGTDIERVTGVVDAVGRAMADDPEWSERMLDVPRVLRVEALEQAGITLKILGTVRAGDRWAAAGELRRRILIAFAEHKIDITQAQQAIGVEPTATPTASDPVPTDEDLASGTD